MQVTQGGNPSVQGSHSPGTTHLLPHWFKCGINVPRPADQDAPKPGGLYVLQLSI